MSVPLLETASVEKRKRDLEHTREIILDAARVIFSEHGFDGAGTREIAKRAGCNIALINRYFGSKAGLYREVMEHCIDLEALRPLTAADLPAAFADIALLKGQNQGEFDPMAAAIRSSSSTLALDIIKEEMGNPMVEVLAGYIGGHDAKIRAALVLSVIAGFHVGRHIMGADALACENDADIRPRLEATFRTILAS